MTCILILSVWTICCTLLITQPKRFPKAQCSSLKHRHCPKAQAHTWQAKPLLMGFKKTLWQLHCCLPNPLLPFTVSMPQEKGFHCLLNKLSFLMLLSLCPCPSFSVSLETFYTFFKTQRKCIFLKRSQVIPGRAACPLFLLMGREL